MDDHNKFLKARQRAQERQVPRAGKVRLGGLLEQPPRSDRRDGFLHCADVGLRDITDSNRDFALQLWA